MFQPAVLHPDPDPWFVKELTLIDPQLRVVFGYERYMLTNWVIEYRMNPMEYARRYFSFLTSGQPRFIAQPIYDRGKPIYEGIDTEGQPIVVGYQQVGERTFDMAPEWEWRKTIRHRDGSFKPLGMDDILDLKKEYAWNRNHAFSRAKFEAEEREKEARKQQAFDRKLVEIGLEALDEARLQTGRRVTAKPLTLTE